MPEIRHIVLGTAGHIDHGKTALVRAVTGVDTDRLEEEKRRGITIELGFAPWRLAPDLEASIVDVPGHERLVRTMVAGAGGMDLAMLVVAADDGVMPQTREHLDILKLLAVPAGLVVITKVDLVDEELAALVEEEVREACRHSILETAPVIHTSSKTGQGLTELRETVARLARRVEARTAEGPAFLPLDRLFHKAGHGAIGTGTLLRGALRVGDALDAFGDAREPTTGLKVRGLQALGAARDAARAGMRTAVNLSGRDVEAVRRGMVLGTAGAFVATDALVAWVEVLPRAEALEEQVAVVHLGTSERQASIIPLGSRQIEPGQAGGVLLRLERPLAAYAGQRLVLRRPGVHGQATVAGGELLDPEPPRGKRSVSLAASEVAALVGGPAERLLAIARESRAAGLLRRAVERRLPPGKAEQALAALEAAGTLLRLPGQEERWVEGRLIDTLAVRVVERVAAHHEASPLSPGLAEAELASWLPPPERHLAAAAVERAVQAGRLSRLQALLSIPGRGAQVDARAEQDKARLLSALREAPYTPPAADELAQGAGIDRKRAAELLELLRREALVVRVAEGLYYDAGVMAAIEARVVELLSRQAEMTASQFKALAGNASRKFAIPLLEHLDRSRVTLRVGDTRRLHPSRRLT